MKTQGDRECISKMPSLRVAWHNIFANTFCVCFMNYWRISHWILWQITLSSCNSCPWKNLRILIYYKVHCKRKISWIVGKRPLNNWSLLSSWHVTAPYSRLEKSNSILVGQNFDRCIGCTQKGSSKIDLPTFISRLTEHTLSIMKEM